MTLSTSDGHSHRIENVTGLESVSKHAVPRDGREVDAESGDACSRHLTNEKGDVMSPECLKVINDSQFFLYPMQIVGVAFLGALAGLLLSMMAFAAGRAK